jgi:HAD superfamily hydrolase (TIGR01458 family)
LAAIKAIFLDLGGVVFVGDRPIAGAIAAIDRLRGAGLSVRFLTNTTRSAHGQLVAKLGAMGLSLAPEELFTPALAARDILAGRGLAPHLLVHPALEIDFAGLAPAGGKAVVVGDAGEAFDYAAMNTAFRALMDGADFLALANNRSFRDADGGLSLDAGPFVAALAFASGRTPEILGKPAPAFFLSALASMGCAPQEAAMIGDDVESDVGGAMAVGMAGLLVRTGKYAPGDEARIDPAPSAVVGDLAAAADWLLAAGLEPVRS